MATIAKPPHISLRLPPDLVQKMDDVAESLGVSRGAAIRIALAHFDETTLPSNMREQVRLLTFGRQARS